MTKQKMTLLLVYSNGVSTITSRIAIASGHAHLG